MAVRRELISNYGLADATPVSLSDDIQDDLQLIRKCIQRGKQNNGYPPERTSSLFGASETAIQCGKNVGGCRIWYLCNGQTCVYIAKGAQ